MRTLLAWVFAAGCGVGGAVFLGIRDSYRASLDITLQWDTLVFYSDRLSWLGAMTTGFAISDFIRRATDTTKQHSCSGSLVAWLMTFNLLALILLVLSYGMVLMAEPTSIVERVSLPLVNGYAAVLIGGVLVSLLYALYVDLAS